MFTILFLSLTLTITSSSTLQLPVRRILTLEDSELSVLDFIRLSYQPLLFPEALSTSTLTSLTPWTFPALPTSLEAATTFCVASTGSLSHHDNIETEKDVKERSKGKKSKEDVVAEREENEESKENAETRLTGKDVEESKDKRREEGVNAKSEKIENRKARKTVTEEEIGARKTVTEEEIGARKTVTEEEIGARKTVTEEEIGARKTVTEEEIGARKTVTEEEIGARKTVTEEEIGARKTVTEEEIGARKTVTEEEPTEYKGMEGCTKKMEEDKEIPMSLRRFGVEGPGEGWVTAFTSLTKELGTAVTLPGVLKDADLAFLDFTKTGLRHVRKGWTGPGEGCGSSSSSNSARVVCILEGVLTSAFTPLPPSLAALQCAAGECWATVKEPQEQAAPPDLSFLVQATTHPRACFYAPPGWQWAATVLEDSTFLIFTWEDDLVIKEDVADRLFEDEEEDGSKRTQGGLAQEKAIELPTLWEALPKGPWPAALLLWGDQNPLLHLLRRYLLSGRHLRRNAFLQEFIVDRQLVPDLVDCSRECRASGIAVFKLLDADGDGELTPADATLLTHDAFTSISHQLDDLVDELNDLAREQWEEAVEGPEDARSAFLRRAKERLSASATAAVRRWVAGDLEETEEEVLKGRLPDLHEQVLAAKGVTAPRDKEEL